ncbi:RNA-directed DNA polymerase, eukaryota, Reverse transcriptase zinc-binding domain protein [Artemisia annua]|uniref:RNA-directed DNA polymerase, eukaryota, Reverse transcriptase zinc-binding domain protein n=1 Tax=Artemisia annua TaxID=35608 RepID=A0A2U1QKC2_ARTAN|nr:RNA-directed DNA polymerase, eukaryota, Reverse transcriptase zinc-binding domain protein [Artemisia annua]
MNDNKIVDNESENEVVEDESAAAEELTANELDGGVSIKDICDKTFRNWEWTSNVKFSRNSCRIVIGWNDANVQLRVLHMAKQSIFCEIINSHDKSRIFCSFIYASNSGSERRELWKDLNLYSRITKGHPWVIMGDFNVTLKVEEHSMGGSLITQDMQDFIDCTVESLRGIHLTNNTTVKRVPTLKMVDLPTFKAKLLEFNILVWNQPNGKQVRIHGDDNEMPFFINKIRHFYLVKGTATLSDVRKKIERDLRLTPGSYELTYKQHQTSSYNLLKTDLDWHHAVEGSKAKARHVRLNLEAKDNKRIATKKAAYDEYVKARSVRLKAKYNKFIATKRLKAKDNKSIATKKAVYDEYEYADEFDDNYDDHVFDDDFADESDDNYDDDASDDEYAAADKGYDASRLAILNRG